MIYTQSKASENTDDFESEFNTLNNSPVRRESNSHIRFQYFINWQMLKSLTLLICNHINNKIVEY